MNKGIIMEVKKNYAIAMNDDGIMNKLVFKDNMKVGQKIFYFEDDVIKDTTKNIYRHNNFRRAFGSIAALFLIVFTFFHIMKPQEAYAVVSLDINPSIQIEADSNLNIIKAEGVNDDGKNIDFSDIKDIPLESGIQKIKDELIEKNYLSTNREVLVGYAFVQNGDNNTYEKDLKGVIESTFKTETVTYVAGDKEDINKAKEQGISLGRYEASLKVEDKEIKNKIDTAPVKDITASIRDTENAKEWNAKDEQNNNVPIVNETPEVKSEKPEVGKPNINASADTTKPNVDSNSGKDNISKPGSKDDVLDLKPDTPIQNGNSGGNNNSTVTNPPKESSTDVSPNTGSTENNTNSGKVKDDSTKVITPEQSIPVDKNSKN